MDKTKAPSPKRTKELLDFLSDRLFRIEDYYLVYSEVELHINVTVDEGAAKKYLEAINDHKGFFMPVREALRATLTVELCSFVVRKEQRYKSIGKAIELLKELPDAPDLSHDYNALLRKHENIISHIETFRNQYYAHKSFADLLKLPTSSDIEFRNLFADLKTLLNSALAYFNSSTWFLDESSRESVNDTHNLLNNLLRAESQRSSEIDVEYYSDIYKSGKSRWLGK